jgi:hypothetical protein
VDRQGAPAATAQDRRTRHGFKREPDLRRAGRAAPTTAVSAAPVSPAVRVQPAWLPWSLTSLREKLIKIGAKVVSHGRYVTFQLAEIALSRQMFADILSLIARLRAPPAPA